MALFLSGERVFKHKADIKLIVRVSSMHISGTEIECTHRNGHDRTEVLDLHLVYDIRPRQNKATTRTLQRDHRNLISPPDTKRAPTS